MRVIFTRIARTELEDAVRFYELEYSGLGRRFKKEVRKAALPIVDYPQAWSIEPYLAALPLPSASCYDR